MRIRWIPSLVGLLLAACAITPALATTAVVPDSFPTVQSGIDSGRDTVLVRDGRYEEDLTSDHGFTLLACPTLYGEPALPQVGSLTAGCCGESWSARRHLLVRGVRFRGKVEVRGWYEDATFETCRMDSGLSVPSDIVGVVDVNGCTVLGGMSVACSHPHITLNSVYGGGLYVFGDGDYWIQGNYVHGPAPWGINAGGWGGGRIEGNTVVATETGVMARVTMALVRDNEVLDCTGSAFVIAEEGGTWERNRAARCGGYAFDRAEGRGLLVLTRNEAVDCARGGVRAPGLCSVDSNVVGRCGGPGIEVGNGYVRRNTSYLNQGAGYIVRGGSPEVGNNIAFGNLGFGLVWEGTAAPGAIRCNDWFGNAAGEVSGTVPGVTDVSANPLFCDLAGDDLHLSAGSPLLSLGACGLVGALGQGCVEALGAPVGEGAVRAFTASPNPSRGEVRFAWAGSARAEWIDVYDVTGARRWGQAVEPGESAHSWRGTDASGRRLPAGVYYARLTGREASATTRLVIVQ